MLDSHNIDVKPHAGDPDSESRALLTPEASRRSVNKKVLAFGGLAIIAAGAGGALAATIFLKGPSEERANGVTPETGDRQTSQAPTPATEVSSPAPETSSSPEVAQSNTIEAIPAGLSAEQYGSAIVSTMSTWVMKGTSDEFSKEWLFGSSSDNETLLNDTTAEVADEVTNAIFVNDWQNNTSLETFRAKFLQYNSASLDLWLHTYKSGHNEDKEPYNLNYTVDSVEQLASDNVSRTIEITGYEHNNADESRIGDPSSKIYAPIVTNSNGRSFTYVFTTKIENGIERISSWQIV